MKVLAYRHKACKKLPFNGICAEPIRARKRSGEYVRCPNAVKTATRGRWRCSLVPTLEEHWGLL